MIAPDDLARAGPVVAGLTPAARTTLAAHARLRTLEAGALLWQAGDPAHGLYVVLDGRVRVVRLVDGRQHVVHTEGPGGTLGEVALFGDGTHPATALADGPARCLVLDRHALDATLAVDASLAHVLLHRLATRVRGLVARLDGLVARSVRARLAGALLERSANAPARGFTLGGSQEALAEELGTVREVLVRELRRLRAEGLVTSPARGRFAVPDAEALRRVAEGLG